MGDVVFTEINVYYKDGVRIPQKRPISPPYIVALHQGGVPRPWRRGSTQPYAEENRIGWATGGARGSFPSGTDDEMSAKTLYPGLILIFPDGGR